MRLFLKRGTALIEASLEGEALIREGSCYFESELVWLLVELFWVVPPFSEESSCPDFSDHVPVSGILFKHEKKPTNLTVYTCCGKGFARSLMGKHPHGRSCVK